MANLQKSPVGELQWVFITGQGKQNFNGDGYNYCADLVLKTDSDACQGLKDLILEEFHAEMGTKANAKSTGWRDKDDGNTVFTFKTGATFKDGTPQVITTFDKNGNKFDLGDTKIGNGSVGKVFFNIGTYTFQQSKGVSLYLKAIQIASLNEYTDLPQQADSIDGDFETDQMTAEPIDIGV